MSQKYDVLLDFKQIHKLKVKRKVHVQGISATNAEPADVIFYHSVSYIKLWN